LQQVPTTLLQGGGVGSVAFRVRDGG
jgi:hypothetical protein